MLDKHGLDEGPVYDDCVCDADTPPPERSVILPPRCYSPDGTVCDWYQECLNKMFSCTGEAEHAISYGEQFCNLYGQTELQLTETARQWINAVRKCLQVALVPVLHFCRVKSTCEDIKRNASTSHVPCYTQPYQGFSVCSVPVSDWLRIFWTIKSSFASSTFVETFKGSVTTAAKCPGSYNDQLRKYLYSMSVWLWEGGLEKCSEYDDMSDDELAHAVVYYVSSSHRWSQEYTMDWYAFFAKSAGGRTPLISPDEHPGKELTVQVRDSLA